jgi:hypothetical protein
MKATGITAVVALLVGGGLALHDVLFIPGGTIHAARNVGSDNGAELATYIVEKGKPLVEMVE